MVEIHPSIGQLSRLRHLELSFCSSLANLPSISAKTESLTVLNLGSCSNLRMIPKFKGILKSLSELRLSWTAIKELPPTSFQCLSSLKYLTLRGITFVTLPLIISQLSHLDDLDFSHCVKLRSVPELPASVTYIKAEGCTSLEPLPALLKLSSLSRPPSQSYDESSGGVAFTILNRYLQVLSLTLSLC